MCCVATVAILIQHIFQGGLGMDDWVDGAHFAFPRHPGFWNAVRSISPGAYRKPLVVTRALEIWSLGYFNVSGRLALVAFGAALEGFLAWVVARRLGLERVLAAAGALLVIVAPFADSSAFWDGEWISALFARGAAFAVLLCFDVSVRADRRSVRWASAVMAVALSILSGWGYSLGAPLIVVGSLVILRLSRPRRWGIQLFTADLFGIVGALWLSGSESTVSGSLHYLAMRTWTILGHGSQVALSTLVPTGWKWTAQLATLAAIYFLLTLILVLRVRRGEQFPLTKVVAHIALGATFTYAGWVMIIPGSTGYDPLSTGVQNRVNVVAVVGVALLGVGLAEYASIALVPNRDGFDSQTIRRAVATLVLILVVIGNLLTFNTDQLHWNAAGRVSRSLLSTLARAVPRPGNRSVIYTFGVAGYYAPTIPIFGGGGNNDLLAAARLLYNSPELRAFPVLEGMQFTCGTESAELLNTGIPSTAPYRNVIFVNIHTREVEHPTSRATCSKDLSNLPIGPTNFLNS